MNIFQPPYVYSRTMAKRKPCIIGEIVLWIGALIMLALNIALIFWIGSWVYTAFVMSVWSYWRF